MFDDFNSKLSFLKKSYEKKYGKPLETIDELEKFVLSISKVFKKSRAVKSLKHFSL